MLPIVVANLVVAFQVTGSEIDPDQFARLMQGLRSDIQDVSFICEGENRFVGPGRLLEGNPDTLSYYFQGSYAFRSDESTLLDIYKMILQQNKYYMRLTCLDFGGKTLEFARSPDVKQSGRPNEIPSFPGNLNRPGSPERILYLAYFHSIPDPAHFGYEYQGWEDVDGHRCLRIQLDVVPNAQVADKSTVRYWIDLERGGHPLKVERYRGSNLLYRIDKIELEKVPFVDGKEIWFPIRGEYHSFRWKNDYYSRPIFRETYKMVDGSIRFNQGLPDSLFSLDWKEGMPSTLELRRLRAKFDNAPPSRSDPASVKERLDKALVEADEQSKMLEASSPARQFWSGTLIAQIVFGVIGIALITTALIWMWRGR